MYFTNNAKALTFTNIHDIKISTGQKQTKQG